MTLYFSRVHNYSHTVVSFIALIKNDMDWSGLYCQMKLSSPSPHGVDVIQTKSITVSVHKTLNDLLPCINVSPFFLLLHVPPENRTKGSLKLEHNKCITTNLNMMENLLLKTKKCFLGGGLSPFHPFENSSLRYSFIFPFKIILSFNLPPPPIPLAS